MDKPSMEQFLDVYEDLFVGRPDVYAVLRQRTEKNGEGKHVVKKSYAPSTHESVQHIVKHIGTEQYTRDAMRMHCEGYHSLGVYPIHEDSNVKFFALDFDGKNGDPWVAVKRQQKIFREEAGIETYIERSRGGAGYHLWGFVDEMVPANKLVRGLKPFIEESEVFDRMVPMQSGVTETRPLGNLIALPFDGTVKNHGNSLFVDIDENGDPKPIKNQFAYLKNIRKISVDKVYELFANAPDPATDPTSGKRKDGLEGLSGSYKLTHPVFGCEWIRWAYEQPEYVSEPEWYALACQFAQLKDGRQLFHEWSKRDKKRYTYAETEKYFNRALEENKPHRCATMRETLRGPECTCDKRYPDIVSHPYDLVKVPLQRLIEEMESAKPDVILVNATDGINDAIEWAERVHKDPEEGAGIKYGIDELDKHTRLRDTDLVVLAARPGIGKTAFALDVCYRIAKSGTPCYFFSLEMSRGQLWKRVLSRGAQVNNGLMSTGQLKYKDWRKVKKFQKELINNPLPFYVDDVSRSTLSITEMAGEYISLYGKGVIVFDYLQLAQGLRNEGTYEKVSRVVNDLKVMGKVLQVPVLSLAQLNRTAEQDAGSTDAEPQDSWIRGSGEIEQTADVIMFLLGKKGPGIKERQLVIHKERHRESGIHLPFEFNQPFMTFGSAGTFSSIGPAGQKLLPLNQRPFDFTVDFEDDAAWGIE